jgi:hypothetical protein
MKALIWLLVLIILRCPVALADDWQSTPSDKLGSSAAPNIEPPHFQPAPPSPLRLGARDSRTTEYTADTCEPFTTQRTQFSTDESSTGTSPSDAQQRRYTPPPRSAQDDAPSGGQGTIGRPLDDEDPTSPSAYAAPSATGPNDDNSFSAGNRRYIPPADVGSAPPIINAPPTVPSASSTTLPMTRPTTPPTMLPTTRLSQSAPNRTDPPPPAIPPAQMQTQSRDTTTPTIGGPNEVSSPHVGADVARSPRGFAAPPSNASGTVNADARQRAEEDSRLGNSYFLMLLALFGSVGLNLYLGWITWDTYNRYQDLVADMRPTGPRRTSSSAGVSSHGEAPLVEAAAY